MRATCGASHCQPSWRRFNAQFADCQSIWRRCGAHQPPPSAPPVTAQSPPASEAAKHHEERNSTEQRAADLRRQVSGLQSLVAQVKQQLAQRKAQKSPVTDAGGQPATDDAQEQQAADLQRQDSELHSQLQGLIAQLGEELQLEMRSHLPQTLRSNRNGRRRVTHSSMRLPICSSRTASFKS